MSSIYKKHEKDIAKRLGGKRQPLSGALPEAKSDVITDKLRIDCKYVHVKSYRLTLDVLKKITMESAGQDIIPAIQIRFEKCGKDIQYDVVSRDWIVVPLSAFEELLSLAGDEW